MSYLREATPKVGIRGETNLISYGIQNEDSDARAHVCAKVRKVYVYPTASGVTAINTGRFRKVPGYQKDRTGNGLLTAYGYLVPPCEIDGCQCVDISPDLWLAAKWDRQDSTTEKGRKAVVTVQNLLLRGLLKLPAIHGLACRSNVITNVDIDIAGTDIYVFAKIKMQVKCDFVGGPKSLGGSGSLYLQVSERNPFARH